MLKTSWKNKKYKCFFSKKEKTGQLVKDHVSWRTCNTGVCFSPTTIRCSARIGNSGHHIALRLPQNTEFGVGGIHDGHDEDIIDSNDDADDDDGDDEDSNNDGDDHGSKEKDM